MKRSLDTLLNIQMSQDLFTVCPGMYTLHSFLLSNTSDLEARGSFIITGQTVAAEYNQNIQNANKCKYQKEILTLINKIE